ncbi:M15 family metallopeptidase [Nocardioides zeae]|uniref:D-alanyl-D-alanine dipeptidase n=1 Tax=Nocardioides imazamoxiresistens TaxID=3231893 RepID=A0ABU3PTV4_9ACTN|nr:M15 family metallopeptidase [Nocardioides zeae]MDT9592660.1 M15 family metallopeptidase [Nocardioides zeae]
MTILLSDPRVHAVPVRECGEPLVTLGPAYGPARARVRTGLARRLARAAAALPAGVGLRVVEGHRSVADQRAIVARYAAEVRAAHPHADAREVERLTSRFVAPVAVAPHVAGAAVDLTLVDAAGRLLDLGTPIDATPEQSGGRCYFDAPGISPRARAHRALLAAVLTPEGFVNYPTEWWHWSHGDQYWALATGVGAAMYGPVGSAAGAAA